MLLLLGFAFVSGLVTIFAPCIWPLLPIILSSTSGGGRKKPLGITLGITTSFAFFTLALSYILKVISFDPNSLRLVAVVVIGFLGLTLAIPALSQKLEALVSQFSSRLNISSKTQSNGFVSGYVTGFSLGLVWSPCAGPILATIAALAATQQVNLAVILVTLVYVAGVGIPLFIFSSLGSLVFEKSRLFNKYTGRIQQIFGVLMILTALAIYTNYDKVLQAKLLDLVPSYSNFILKLENNPQVKNELDKLKTKPDMGSLPSKGTAPEFVGITNWLNTDKPLTMAGLRGKVVLVDFWTYTCINCIRTLPYVTSWYEKYKDMGFVVVGVHTPEFEFEKKTENVLGAIKQYKINYPVAQDNDYRTWNAYNNRYWPAEYLIDVNGNVRRTHFGEGEYEETELAIRRLLEEANNKPTSELTNLKNETPDKRLTPETYLGLGRMEKFASNEKPVEGLNTFTSGSVPENFFSYEGKWFLDLEYAKASAGSKLLLNFKANKVFLVITPNGVGRVKVFLDDAVIPSSVSGKDVKDGFLNLDTARLYEIVDLKDGYGIHLLKLEFENDGSQVFAFTFG